MLMFIEFASVSAGVVLVILTVVALVASPTAACAVALVRHTIPQTFHAPLLLTTAPVVAMVVAPKSIVCVLVLLLALAIPHAIILIHWPLTARYPAGKARDNKVCFAVCDDGVDVV